VGVAASMVLRTREVLWALVEGKEVGELTAHDQSVDPQSPIVSNEEQ
jgi:hypothetical protein